MKIAELVVSPLLSAAIAALFIAALNQMGLGLWK
jgi:hypothetical protein